MISPSRGSTCVATRPIAPIGSAADAPHPCAAGGCDVAEDPDLDGRAAHPLWASSPEELLQVRASRGRTSSPGFDLWRIPGRKRLTLGGADLQLTVEVAARRMRVTLAADVTHGAAYANTVPLTLGLRGELDAFQAQAKVLEGHAPAADAARPATRAALLHVRALQALDASQAGASHRDIALALFGLETVVLRWHEDSELRAQVRYLLRRARSLMDGGYLALAGVVPVAATQPGDEPTR